MKWKDEKKVSNEDEVLTWAKAYMRLVLSDRGADHEWITSTSAIFTDDDFSEKSLPVWLRGQWQFLQCFRLWGDQSVEG